MFTYPLITRLAGYLWEWKREKYLSNLKKKGLRIGENVQIIDSFFFDPSHCFLISIGNNCIICPNVRLIAHDASTKRLLGYTRIGKIDIRENCFIGDSAIVLPNITIGPNSIVGAGAVVTNDVPPNTVVAGNPARVIGSLEDFLNKVREQRKGKRVFGKDYFIEKLDEAKRNEILQSVGDSVGFIV